MKSAIKRYVNEGYDSLDASQIKKVKISHSIRKMVIVLGKFERSSLNTLHFV